MDVFLDIFVMFIVFGVVIFIKVSVDICENLCSVRLLFVYWFFYICNNCFKEIFVVVILFWVIIMEL